MMDLIYNLLATFYENSPNPGGATAVFFLIGGFFGLSLLAIIFRFITRVKSFALFGG